MRAHWRKYCNTLGKGTRDPNRHSAAFLQAFLKLSAADQVPEPHRNQPIPAIPDLAKHTYANVRAWERSGCAQQQVRLTRLGFSAPGVPRLASPAW